jgi:uncharacterized repeat protein (TIGR01451 family)
MFHCCTKHSTFAIRVVFTLLAWMALLCQPAWADSPGKNGARTITALNTVVNQSTTLSVAAAAGATAITVASAASLSSGEAVGGGALAAGDVILLYQPRGATIVTTNTPTYGDISAYGGAGNYEIRTVQSVAGNVITLAPTTSGGSCVSGLKNSYANGSQVLRVPQYSSLTVNAGASITSTAWNGTLGGVVALLVQNSLTVNGSITVDALGFRGGVVDGTDRGSGGTETVTWVSDANPAGGQKGEGIASGAAGTFGGVGVTFSNQGGNFDIGAPANGGGGGGSHNGGGGGGANAAATLTPYCTAGTATYTTAATTAFVWCGQGTMPATDVGTTAWTRDPGYKANANARTAQVGGGRGGYTYSANNLDATTAAGAPGLTGWGGDNRRALGGWGGRPLSQNLTTRAFFGGGGGSGGNNNGTGGNGGAGGGLILIEAGSLAGSGSISANGAAGGTTTGAGNDAPGGGGAGGTIAVRAGSGSVGLLRANGGVGGNQAITTAETEGPGGGGGGGIIALSGATGTQQSSGGVGGTTSGPSLSEFPRNGATDGSAGVTGQTAPTLLSDAKVCTQLGVAKTNGTTSVPAGGTTVYTLTVVNSGAGPANNATLTDPSATGLSCSQVSCTAALGGAICPTAASTTIAYLQGAGITLPTLPGPSTLTFTVDCSVPATGQ